jgi:hypothetical protein
MLAIKAHGKSFFAACNLAEVSARGYFRARVFQENSCTNPKRTPLHFFS